MEFGVAHSFNADVRKLLQNCFAIYKSTPLSLRMQMVPDWNKIRESAKSLLQYHKLNHTLSASDVIVALGTNDPRVAERAADLFLAALAPLVVFSGGVSDWTRGLYDRTEAEAFAEIARGRGVPEKCIIIEPKASNTGENVKFTQALLASRGIQAQSAIAVQKPYMERRTFATFSKVWPSLKVSVASPILDYEQLPLEWLSERAVIEIMVGDFDRVLKYPALGFQVEQAVPDDARKAFDDLVRMGFTRHLVPT